METHDPLKNWPEELQEAYANLELPSLYSFILANEKLAVEVRKQNRELKAVTQIAQTMQAALTEVNFKLTLKNAIESENEDEDDYDEEENEEIEALKNEHFQEKKRAESVLISIMDSIENLTTAVHHTTQELLSVIPKKHGLFRRKPDWLDKVERLTFSFGEGTTIIKHKLLTNLSDVGIELIAPVAGDRFSANHHRAIEHTQGGASGTIAKTIRLGYQRDGNVIRFADVCVYKN